MEELEYLWSVVCCRPEHLAGALRYDLLFHEGERDSAPGDQETFFVTSFDHYPDEEEILAALAMWKAENGG